MVTIHLKPFFKKKRVGNNKNLYQHYKRTALGWSRQSPCCSCLARRYRDWLRSATRPSDWSLII